MVKKITAGVGVSVEVFYRPDQSSPGNNSYIFMYCITIENFTNTPIQLLRRNWSIVDTLVGIRIIDGEGVVGKRPVLEPGQRFQYNSATNIHTDIGKMYGVLIPEFMLVVPFKAN